MALKKILSEEDFNKLSDALKELYSKGSDDKYHLDLDDDDAGALKRAKEHEKTARQEAEKKLREAEKELEDIRAKEAAEREKKAREGGDLEALENSYKEQIKKLKADHKAEIATFRQHYTEDLVDQRAAAFAAEVSTAPDLLLPHIRNRFSVDFTGERPTVRVLDGEGKVSALTMEDLKKEVVNSERFAPIITGSKASGGGAAGGSKGGGAAKKFNEMTSGELKELRQSDPGAYDRLKSEADKGTTGLAI